jgi:predicted dithiol-disulfide oxidoreductase (DUF899 family)
MRDELEGPKIVDRGTFHADLDALRVREKAHTREGDAIAAARRRLPTVEVDGATPLIGERGAVTLLDVFEGRRMLIAYYFMWHTGHPALEPGGTPGGMMHIVCYLRQGSNVFETYWTTRRGVEAMDNSYRLLDLTVYGRQEMWEDSPAGWPQRFQGKESIRTNGRPTAQWSRLAAGRSDNLGATPR